MNSSRRSATYLFGIVLQASRRLLPCIWLTHRNTKNSWESFLKKEENPQGSPMSPVLRILGWTWLLRAWWLIRISLRANQGDGRRKTTMHKGEDKRRKPREAVCKRLLLARLLSILTFALSFSLLFFYCTHILKLPSRLHSFGYSALSSPTTAKSAYSLSYLLFLSEYTFYFFLYCV